ncbi:MAG: hypothetical protein P8P98_06475 [Emcibacteraceae bacterium]|nr:hypothetical protein [Emcibacteraceae bacterium]MDG1996658.1 hypothetical protein [Emcibacteraceae bacterium]
MQSEQNIILDVKSILIKTYGNLRDSLISYMILCYVMMLPMSLWQLISPLAIDTQTTQVIELLPRLLCTLVFLLFFSIFLYRLFLLGKDRQYKVTPSKLIDIFTKTFIYTLALGAVMILALLSVVLLFGLMVSVINSVAGESALENSSISTLILFFISILLMLIVFRTLPTFISIAIGEETIPMKSAYYYTRDNGKRLILIGLGCYIPMSILSGLLIIAIAQLGITGDTLGAVLSFILSPLSIAPFALQTSAGAEIFKALIPGAKEHLETIKDHVE